MLEEKFLYARQEVLEVTMTSGAVESRANKSTTASELIKISRNLGAEKTFNGSENLQLRPHLLTFLRNLLDNKNFSSRVFLLNKKRHESMSYKKSNCNLSHKTHRQKTYYKIMVILAFSTIFLYALALFLCSSALQKMGGKFLA